MTEQNQSGSDASATAALCIEATDVTGTHTVRVSSVEPNVPAGVLAAAIAARMSLPDNVPWALRDDATSVFLDDQKAVGDQIRPDAKVTITPRTHLG
jgi:hypothetical protein